MAPSIFMLLDSCRLPLTARSIAGSLPAPDQNRPEQDSSFVAPRTPVEELLARIWAEVLELERWAYMTTSSSWAVIHCRLCRLPLGFSGTFGVGRTVTVSGDAPAIAMQRGDRGGSSTGAGGRGWRARAPEELKQLSPDE